MVCPSCKNKGFVPSEDISRPHVVVKTERLTSSVLRYRVCLQCGYRWMTEERFYRAVHAKTEPTLFAADGNQ